MSHLNVPLIGIGFALLAAFIGASQDAIVKWLAAEHALFQLLFVRSVVMLLVVGAWIAARSGARGFRTRQLGGQALRVACNLLAFLAFYYALTQLPLADATAIALSAPLFMTLLSGPLLGERVGARRALAVALGFAGVLLMLQPARVDANWLGQGAALATAVLYALWMLLTRRLSAGDASELMVFYSALGFFAASVLVVPFQWVTPAGGDFGLMVVIGLTGVGVHYTLAQAYRHAPVYVVSPFEYTVLVWAVLLGYLLWGDVPGWDVLAGAAVVIASGLYILHRERRLARVQRVAARAIPP